MAGQTPFEDPNGVPRWLDAVNIAALVTVVALLVAGTWWLRGVFMLEHGASDDSTAVETAERGEHLGVGVVAVVDVEYGDERLWLADADGTMTRDASSAVVVDVYDGLDSMSFYVDGVRVSETLYDDYDEVEVVMVSDEAFDVGDVLGDDASEHLLN